MKCFSLWMVNIFICCLSLHAQTANEDSTTFRPTKDLGMYIGGAYSLVQLDAKPYFVGTTVATPQLNNSPGMFGGFCYNFYASRNLLVRPAVEAAFLPATITYQTEIDYQTRQRIFPMTIDFPISFIYSAYRIKSFPRPSARPEWGISIRPVLTVKPFNDVQPVMRTSNLNTDVFVGYPIGNAKSVMRVELFYSHGWLNLIGDDTNFRTYSIIKLHRHFTGVRFIFH